MKDEGRRTKNMFEQAAAGEESWLHC